MSVLKLTAVLESSFNSLQAVEVSNSVSTTNILQVTEGGGAVTHTKQRARICLIFWVLCSAIPSFYSADLQIYGGFNRKTLCGVLSMNVEPRRFDLVYSLKTPIGGGI